MALPDLNLLHTLDVLLAKGSVVGAGRELGLSPSAMSRALARLRQTTGDQLLVRAGRGLVPTARAIEIRDQVRSIVEDARMVLRPVAGLNLSRLERSFTFRTSDGLSETLGPRLIARVHEEAPGVRLRFVRKLDKDNSGLRDGSYDLETGVIARATGPEFKARSLFVDRYVGVVRGDHPIRHRSICVESYTAWSHVVAWRQGLDLGGVDDSLTRLGVARDVMTTVDGFSAALALARGSDLIATVPKKHTAALREGMYSFALPVETPAFTLSLLWHPRLDGDPAHRWLRECVIDAAQAIASG